MSTNTFVTLASSLTDSMKASIITGIATFSSNSEPMPPRPAVVTTVSLPSTRQATCIADSQMTGFTLPGMIDEPGWVAGSDSSKMPQRGPDAEPADVVGDFRERNGDRLQFAVGFDERVLGGLGFGVVRRLGELARPARCVSAAHTLAANCGCVLMPVPTAVPPIGMFSCKSLERPLGPDDRVLGLGRVAGEHLADADRRGVHQMRAADLDDLVPLLGLGGELARAAARARGSSLLAHDDRRGDVHRGRERVVRRLAHVDVVVGMDRAFLALRADAEAQLDVRHVGDHLVGVHVGRGAGAGLVDVDREVVVVLAGGDLLERR